MEKRTIRIGISAALLLAVALPLSAAEVSPREIAEKAAGQLGRELQMKLSDSIQKSGPAASIDVCAREAPLIIARIEQELGVSLQRTALRIRNPQNIPDAVEKGVLQSLTAARQAG